MKISTKMMKGILGFIGVLFLLAPLTAFSQDSMIVIPVAVSKPLKNIITVAKGNGKFTDPVAAVASINDATVDNPYLVVIGPGVYTVTSPIVMKEYVDIAGSGEDVTKIMGAFNSGATGIISGANHSALSSLTVESTWVSGASVALYNNNASPRVSNVTATASKGAMRIGIYNYSSSPKMTNVTAKASGGNYNFGISNNISNPVLTNVTAYADGMGSSQSYGVYNYGSSTPLIRRSTMDGSTGGLGTVSGTATVSQSTIYGGAVGGTRNKCVACDNGNGLALDKYCAPIP